MSTGLIDDCRESLTRTGGRPAPWRELPRELADVLQPELASLADEIVAEIRHGVPEFDRPLQGAFGAGIRLGVEQGLRQFVGQIADPTAPAPHDPSVPRALGRGEFHEGRSMDALQAAYRIGARAAWRRFAACAMRAGHSAETLCALAEAVFAYIEEVAAHSVYAYSELAAEATDTSQRRRRRLLELLTTVGQPVSHEAVVRLATESGWRVPARVACVALSGSWQDRHLVSPAVSPDVLMDLESPEPFLLVPDADGPGRQEMLVRALGDSVFAVGPTVDLAEASLSLQLARRTLALCHRGVITAGSPVRAADHLSTLLLFGDEDIVELMTRDEYAPLAEMPPARRERLVKTLFVLLTQGGSAPEIAGRLHVHPQTVRYRMNLLHELYGPRLHDPDWRFRMQIVLRRQILLDGTAGHVAAGGR
ncbi:PucR family transcriptional regulator [Actinomadura craniellae]|uniref:PucR family transcriptional regulator n=1 Tax=Actinomadura craniellae TaxID=2231787 RepID=A0A365HB84_9ACTN|nr:PucR family transcriptional regulator [Actinomadura craniellae]RAY16299.1 PucR family transcriptional regulator [Actinomadura craniellae]